MMIEKLKNILKLNRNKHDKKSVEERIDEMFDTLGVDDIQICVGEDLVPFCQNLCDEVWNVRKKIKDETGLILPQIRIIDNSNFQENEYQIKIRSNTAFVGYTVPKEDYALNEITRNLEKTCIENVDKVLSNELTEKYINFVQNKNSWLVWYLLRLVPPTGIKIILVNLIKNGKSINDITYIFERICDIASKDKDMCCIRDPYKISRALNCEFK